MKLKSILLNTIFLFLLSYVFAQPDYSSHFFKSDKIYSGKADSSIDYMPVLLHYGHNNPNLMTLKDHANSKSSENSRFRTSKNVSMPQILDGFESVYDSGSIPNDDAIAVSNSGNIITIRNSKINFYNEDFLLLNSQSLNSFTSVLGISGAKYDPRVVYDHYENRFIIVLLSGYDYSTNQIIVCFSASDDPMGDWHFYSIPGNIFEDDTWSDYPTIAINENELFISVTNFADMTSWDTWDFYGARIIQMNKFHGYEGDDEVDYVYHLVNPGFPVDIPSEIYYYNVTPVKGGRDLYGPNMYFLSTLDCPFPDELTGDYPANDTLFLLEFSGDIYDDDFEITSELLFTDVPYQMSVNTPQPEGLFLSTNYNTIKDSYYENNNIHFVMNSLDPDNNQAGVLHGIINDVGNTNLMSCNMISFDTIGVAFAAIAYTGSGPDDDKAIIGFNYTSETHFPGNACIYYDNGEYSNLLVLKEGLSVMNLTSSQTERWGDFTTIQIKHNEPHIAYFVGSFGRYNRTRTWVSKILIPDIISGREDFETTEINAHIYPNPVSEMVTVSFETDVNQVCFFDLYDINGRKLADLYARMVKSGINEFSFNISHLEAGIYILKITGDNDYTYSKSIVKE